MQQLQPEEPLCHFSDITDQLSDLVDRIAQPGLWRTLLEKVNITWICRSWEPTAHQTAQIASSSSAAAALSTTAEVHAIAHSQQTRRNQNRNQPQTPPDRDEPECPNCGYLGHTAGVSCPARGRTCHKCGNKTTLAERVSQPAALSGPTRHEYNRNKIRHEKVAHTTSPTSARIQQRS